MKRVYILFGIVFSFLATSCGEIIEQHPVVGDFSVNIPDKKSTIDISISHVKDNIYGVKLKTNMEEGEGENLDFYLESSYNKTERILSMTKNGSQIGVYQFSEDFDSFYIIQQPDYIATRK